MRNRVLVVDDDRMIRALLEDSLNLEFDVETADGADSCMEILKKSSFDAMVLDLMMPKVTGLELFQQVRELDREMPVIILTAYGSKESAIEALRLGAHDYLEKPVEREHLIHSLRRGIERRKLKDENSYLVDQLRQRVEKLKIINQMGAALASSLDIDRVLSMAMQMSKRAVGAESCCLRTYDEARDELEFRIGLDRADTEVRSSEETAARMPATGDAIAQWVVSHRQPALIADASADPRCEVESAGAGSKPIHADADVNERVRSVIAVPLLLRDKVLGVIELINKADGSAFTKSDVFFIRLTANFITVAIENANLATDLKRSRAEVEAHNRILEEKVIERTAELTKSNADLEKANRTLIDTQKKLVHSEKLASVGQLAAGVAHEINNPLGFINSNLTTMADYGRAIFNLIKKYESFEEIAASFKQPKLDAYLKTIVATKEDLDIEYLKTDLFKLLDETREGTNRVSNIVQGLKRFSHVDQDAVEPININLTIEETLALVRSEIKYRADIELDFADIPPIIGNASLLSQVFMNIILNAAQAIEKWGLIRISTRAENGYVIASFKDNGCGIREENIGKIFDPFFTTKDVGVGTGLGLSISYGIIQKHNGEIEVESKVGEGATFKVKLPVAEETGKGRDISVEALHEAPLPTNN